MLIEAEAIPYVPTSLTGERLLVLAPHPDDEVIGCGGLVAQHARDGRKIRVVVVTDGGAAAAAGVNREDESRRGLATLGASAAELHFLGFPDRSLGDSVIPALREHLAAFRPDLILAPSPVEIHPDHVALSRALCALIQQDGSLFADLAVTKVAFYEISQPLRPNALVAIDDVAELKYSAIREHRSQIGLRDYAEFARGLNTYRAMTLAESRLAEAYYLIGLPELRTTSFGTLREKAGAPPRIEARATTIPVTVVIRTKDRPGQLAEAIASVRATDYPCQIVVVNDGGARPEVEGVRLLSHETSLGRSAAANAGVAAATTPFVMLLDDDDLLYPEHFDVLASATQDSQHVAHYTDAVSKFLRIGPSGRYEPRATMRLFAQDFDPTLLLLDNYIPLPTILLPRETVLELGGFDTAFDLFEDWDLLIRLAQRGSFLHVPRITVEVRHFEGGSSILLAAPEGSDRFRNAKLQVWKKHRQLLSDDLFAAGFEEQKRRLNDLYSGVVEARGTVAAARGDIERIEREKSSLISQLQELHHTINGHVLRTRDLEAALEVGSAQLQSADVHLQTALAEAEELRLRHAEKASELAGTRVEVDRLNNLLAMIFRSKTWKVHNLLERMRGRG
ncbi:MAG: PIG-L family deacetylase [Thermoanaerobaculia bacterium]